jgi:hypothetical protein
MHESSRRLLVSGIGRIFPALLLACLLGAPPLYATVIMRLGFEELVAQSQLIFRGEVIGSVVEQQGDLVYTTVSFAVSETLKGNTVDDKVSLRFVGGSVDGVAVEIEGQFIPAPGDAGVYFVATAQQAQLNPLSGWQQGYFPLLQDAAGADYIDMRQRPDFVIPGLDDDPLIGKMRKLGYSAAEIEARFPQALQFSWADFRAAIVAELQAGAQGGTTP